MVSLLETLVVGGVCWLLWEIITHWNIAIGVSKRKDLKTFSHTYPLIGNLRQSDDGPPGRVHETFAKTIDANGLGSSFTFPFFRGIIVARPDWLEHIQKTNFKNYVKGDSIDPARDILGDGIFAVDGQKWLLARKTIALIFTSNNFNGIISDAVNDDVLVIRKLLRKHAADQKPLDLTQLFFAYTLSSFMKMSLGKDPGCLTEDGVVRIPFAVAFDLAQVRSEERIMEPLWKITEKFSTIGKQMRKSLKLVDDYTYSIIDARMQEIKDKPLEKDQKRNLLDLFLGIRDENGEGLSRHFLRDSILNLIIAGRDTTAQALAWTWFRLMNDRPDWLQKIRAEVEQLGSITFENHKQAVHTLAAFHEGLRLHPSVPKNMWTALDDDVLPNGGPRIRKGDHVVWNDWWMGRNEDIWGPDAKIYKPERWIDEKGSFKRCNNFDFHVFNGGYRLCLGMNLAIFEATVLIGMMAHEFDINFAPSFFKEVEFTNTYKGEHTPMYRRSLTLPMKDPFHVVFSNA